MKRLIHYWNGYGNHCMTVDGRKSTAQSSSRPEQVTCERCLQNLRRTQEIYEKGK